MLKPILSLLALVLLLAGCEEMMREMGEDPIANGSFESGGDDNDGGGSSY